ncbi:MAG: MTH1187 family thiamine-binding protein [Planctomycetes bacterium]|nr:MTH1187 family thiamine-binding protein [Planctomycetota bacterium]
MLIDLSIVPLGQAHASDQLAEVIDLIDASGLSYQLTPTGTCIEGNWEDVMQVARRCHERVKRGSPHVLTLIRIEDDFEETDKLHRNVASVCEKLACHATADDVPGIHV